MKRVTATTCVNCACPKDRHLDIAPYSCLKHEECEAYEPLGSALADAINAKAREEEASRG